MIGLGELLRRERRRVVDIGEHMRSVQALQESEQRWRSLTEALPQLVWSAKPDGACDYFSTDLRQTLWAAIDRVVKKKDEGGGRRDEKGNRLLSSLLPQPSSDLSLESLQQHQGSADCRKQIT